MRGFVAYVVRVMVYMVLMWVSMSVLLLIGDVLTTRGEGLSYERLGGTMWLCVFVFVSGLIIKEGIRSYRFGEDRVSAWLYIWGIACVFGDVYGLEGMTLDTMTVVMTVLLGSYMSGMWVVLNGCMYSLWKRRAGT